MRKQQKKQAEEVIRLLNQVHDGIKKAITAGMKQEAMDLLAKCQESAIELGEAIEETEGETFEAIACLESYCEAVYKIYDAIGQGQPVNGSKAEKTLRKALLPAENSVKNIKVRMEAVFLPYKASMWDSLESVWKAADEAPDCDAYVIPIPYYTKNPDGSFRKEHYEGELYPDYVPVTWYEDYDFAGRQPDVIFIHNPYDNCNYLTSIHPFFYSKNLKNFTEKLVYIPYFIYAEIDPENEKAVKEMEHFCTLPGVIYADRVIVQSENIRRIYVDVMTEFTKSLPMDKKYWKEKILGLGSPKTDKVLNTGKNDVNVPKEWLGVIEKADGSWKKIIFYNTSITALLQNSQAMLVKMRDVFQVFRRNRDEVALLWRPHPLIRATIEAMRPELWKEYEEIVRDYQEGGWGIYDDTADVDRAIALCDGYYGDPSSLVELCMKVKKPVMIQDVKVLSEEG